MELAITICGNLVTNPTDLRQCI